MKSYAKDKILTKEDSKLIMQMQAALKEHVLEGKCTYCEIECTPGNFVDHQSERFCSACWVQHENPQHPDLEAIREKVKTAANTWKFTKKSVDEYKLPNGPHPVKK